jgi:hypothetical protein
MTCGDSEEKGSSAVSRHAHLGAYPDGIRVAAFFTKTYRGVIDPLFAVADPIARCGPDRDLHAALATIDRTIQRYVQDAGIAARIP